MNNLLISTLSQKMCIFPVVDLYGKISREKRSLLHLSKKDDYLSRYNVALRYLTLIFLYQGYEISGGRIHFLFRSYCVRQIGINKHKIQAVIKSRHDKKYEKNDPMQDEKKTLELIVNLLEDQYRSSVIKSVKI